MFSDYMVDDEDSYGDWDCESEWTFTESDCMDMYASEDGVEYCWYEANCDIDCTGECDMDSCYAWITVEGVDYEGNCAELEEMFFNGDDNGDDYYGGDCW